MVEPGEWTYLRNSHARCLDVGVTSARLQPRWSAVTGSTSLTGQPHAPLASCPDDGRW